METTICSSSLTLVGDEGIGLGVADRVLALKVVELVFVVSVRVESCFVVSARGRVESLGVETESTWIVESTRGRVESFGDVTESMCITAESTWGRMESFLGEVEESMWTVAVSFEIMGVEVVESLAGAAAAGAGAGVAATGVEGDVAT